MGYPNDQSNPAGAIPVWMAPAPGAAATNIVANGNTQVKTGVGVFTGLSVNTAGTTSTIKLYDGLSAAGTLLGTFSTTAQGSITLPGGGINFAVGLFAVTAGGAPADVTVTYL